MKTTFSAPEILEARIAPASVFFVSPDTAGGNELKIFKGEDIAGTSTAELDAKAFTNSNATVLLGKGDLLVFDTNDNREVDDGDITLMKVTSGKAMVFFNDIAVGATAGGFDKNELTGLAVSDKFTGEVYTDINGAVITALSAAGELTVDGSELVVQHHAISGLKVTGQITGSVAAGASISNLNVGGPLFNMGTTSLSVGGGIRTGTANDALNVTLNGDDMIGIDFDLNTGESGGNITNVLLATGTTTIHAGSGGDAETGKAGVGGSISKVTVSHSAYGIVIEAGDGGAHAKGVGGVGGSLSSINLTLEPTVDTEFTTIRSGNGGNTGTGNGGKGGNIQTLTLNVSQNMSDLLIEAGAGGTSENKGNGGLGGGVFGLTINALDLDVFHIYGGAGGNAYKGNAGAGGALGNLTVTVDDVAGVNYEGGDGGAASFGKGGAGGGVKTINTTLNSATAGIFVRAGTGGIGSSGGAGGGILDVHFESAALVGDVEITGGDGGSGFAKVGAGGAGGAISKLTLGVDDVGAGVLVCAGDGGGSVVLKSGIGGAISTVTVEVTGNVVGAVEILGGTGGDIFEAEGAKSRTANGGVVKGVTLQNNGTIGSALIEGGFGGLIQFGKGSGGDGGALDKVQYTGTGDVGDTVKIASGIGGGPTVDIGGGPIPLFSMGNGGNSGNVSNVSIEDTSGLINRFEVYAGFPEDVFSGGGKGSAPLGMNAIGTDTKGGSIGSVKGVNFDAPLGVVVVGSQMPAGMASGFASIIGPMSADKSVAGNGGDISNVKGEAAIFSVYAPAGGMSSGKGGNGGNVFGVNVKANSFAHVIAAGDGGDGFTGGAGGSIKGVAIDGDIGNFAAAFGFSTQSASMGGLVAGKGGGFGEENLPLNGSIQNVSATHIASILAGMPVNVNELSYNNAVSKISGITADVIGADVDGDSVFDFTEGSAGAPDFQPDSAGNPITADIAIDGFVLVVDGGIAGELPVDPFKLIQVHLEPEVTVI